MEKNKSLVQTNGSLNFWFCGLLLIVLYVMISSRDITRPFYGLHSWAEASGAWAARSHVRYGLGYTKGISTWAVGENPPEQPEQYLDHPQLNVLLSAAFMYIFGVNEWGLRTRAIIISSMCLLVLLKIFRGLLDDKSALLAGLIFVLFPLTGFFGIGGFQMLTGLLAIWFYFVVIGAFRERVDAKLIHKIGLATALFIGLQFGWSGFFYALAIGVHYVGRCIFRRERPNISLLAILVFSPLSSLALNFIVMASGYGWEWEKIYSLYKWRESKGEMREFLWGAWFNTLWVFAKMNFTLPVLITALLYLTVGQLFVFGFKKTSAGEGMPSRKFPQFWLFLLIPVFQLFILRGCLWRHQTWELPLGPFIAIAAALGVMLLWDIVGRFHQRLAMGCTVVVVVVFVVFSVIGTNYYYAMRWQAPTKIRMFKKFNEKIPSDKSLLSYEDFIVNQHGSKGGFYRPEIAWHLDREIVVARTPEEVEKYAKTGQYPYYLVPKARPLIPLINSLAQRYKLQEVLGEPGERTRDGKFFRAGMNDYFIFDLQSKGPGRFYFFER